MTACAALSSDPLERFASTRPHAPYCTDDFERGVTIRPRDDALEMRYVQVGGGVRWCAYVVFDVDYADAENAWRPAGLPEPTFSVVGPESGRGHLFWELRFPVDLAPPGKPARFLVAVENGMTTRLRADPSYVGLVAKNPLHPSWAVRARDVRYTLSTLAERLSAAELNAHPLRSHGVGRNCDLFKWARLEASVIVREFASETAFAAAVADRALFKNRTAFECPLADKEVGWIVKSIAKWTWQHRDWFNNGRKSVRRGAMGFAPLPPVMEATARLEAIAERRAATVKATHDARRAAMRARIEVAVRDLVAEGKAISPAAVARRSGANRKRVYEHRDLLDQLFVNSQLPGPSGPLTPECTIRDKGEMHLAPGTSGKAADRPTGVTLASHSSAPKVENACG